MVVYQLSCATGHAFEGWYASPQAFEAQSRGGHIDCPMCGDPEVRKLPSAPHVKTGAPVAKPASRREALEALRKFIVSSTQDVGPRFAELARRMHYGEEAHRGIRGQVTPDEARTLQEEGVDALVVPPELKIDDLN